MSIMRIFLGVIILGSMVVFLKTGFLFILIALMPSIVAYYTDTYPRKTSFKIVAAGNVSAMIPTVMPMIKQTMRSRNYDMQSVFSDPSVWMFIYLGAAAGWSLIYLCRYIAGFVVAMTIDYNIKTLQAEQKRLVEEWGIEVAKGTRQSAMGQGSGDDY